MTYGPQQGATPSPLVHGGDGQAIWFWENGLAKGSIAQAPEMVFELDLPDGTRAVAKIPSRSPLAPAANTATSKVLVDDPGRERVTMHWAKVVRPSLLGLRRRVAAGVHFFVEERSDGLIRITVVPSNGQVDPKKRLSHLGAVRYTGARVRSLDASWSFHNQSAAGIYELCTKGDHYLPSRALTSFVIIAHRRDVPGSANQASVLSMRHGLVLPPESIVAPDLIFYPRTTAAPQEPILYSTAHGPIPRVGMFLYDRDDESQPSKLPWGSPDAPAGKRIEPVRAWQANEQAAIAAERDVPRVLPGHPVATIDMNTGEPVQPEQWPQRGEYALTGQRIRFDNWVTPATGTLVTELGWSTSGTNREFNPGPSSSKAQAMNYTFPYDEAHESRILATLFSAWSTTRAWDAWLGMRLIAADVITSWTLLGRPWDQYWKAFSLGTSLQAARGSTPGRGGWHYLRERAWGPFYAVACGLAIAGAGAERDRLLGHRAALLELEDLTSPGHDINHLGWEGRNYNDVPWSQHGIPREYQVAPTFQVGIWGAALYCLLMNGPRTNWSSSISRRIVNAARTLYDNPALPLQHGSPPYYLCTGLNGVPIVPINRGGNQLAHDSVIHGFHHLALCRLLTGDPRWTDSVALRLSPAPFPNVAALRTYLASTMDCWRALAFAITR